MIPARRQLSIRTRLALIYTGLLAAALFAFGAGIYLVLQDQLDANFDAQLIANAEHAADVLAQDADASGLAPASQALVTRFASTGGRVLVLDHGGTIVADSSPQSPILAISSDELTAAAQHEHRVGDRQIAGDVLRLRIEPVETPTGLAGFVVWADSTSRLRSLLTTAATALLLGGLVVTLAALVVGLVLARRALAPVATVTETARSISLSGDFAARVEQAGPRDEVGELALAFNEMLDALERTHQALQRFLGDASHQLRTPLTTIRANLDLARRPDIPADERESILGDAREEAERMGRLIADLLSLARAESGARLEFRRTELDALLVETVRRAAQAAPHVRMSLASVEPAVVDGDADRLRELFGILLDNAARYTPAGGAITVHMSVEGQSVRVLVEDTGVGLDEDDQEHVFERLYRGTRARRVRPSGTGLGLAIARWIAEAHGGSVTLRNRSSAGAPPDGAIATVTLPAAETSTGA